MANTITVSKTEVGTKQFQGAFKEMFFITGSVTDSDAVALTTIGEFDITVAGVALGDMVLGISFTADYDDGTDQMSVTAYVAAANTITIQWSADNAEFAADALNGATMKMLVARPAW